MKKFFTSRIVSQLHARGIELRRATHCSGMDPLADIHKLGGEDPIRTILDVGANVGQSALRFARNFPGATIHSFEPAPESYASGVRATAGAPQVSWHQAAVGKRNGTADFYDSGVTQTASLALAPGNANLGFEKREVSLIRLDDFCERSGIGRVDLLKTDTEGFDLGVLEGCEGLLASGRIRFILCEVGFCEADKEHSFFSPIGQYLERFGWRLAHFYGISEIGHFRHWGTCYADALFARIDAAPGAARTSSEAIAATGVTR